MRYYLEKDKTIEIDSPIVACIGYFDGLHRGHQALLEKTIELAKVHDARSVMISFAPDPKEVITGQKYRHVQGYADRLRIAEAMGIDDIIVMAFTEDLCHMDKDSFFEHVLKRLPIRALVCGFDFHYGYKGQGDAYSLKEAAKDMYEVVIIDEVLHEGEKISSTRVRAAIEAGDIKLVNTLLGYTYFVHGEVVHGRHYGHKIGFPTANVALDEEILYPKAGVYIGYCKVDDALYKAMMDIGHNPTIADDNDMTFEVNIIDFEGDIYGKDIYVYFADRIRDCVRFAGLDELKAQLAIDQAAAKGQADDVTSIL